MSSDTARLGPVEALRRWRNGLVASPRFQSWASKFPLTRRMARADGARLMDLVAGFVHSQVLYAVVELELAPMLQDRPQSVEAMALRTGISAERIQVLAQAAASLGLFVRRKDSTYGLGRLGAALIGVPGLTEMIRHHKVLYADLADPVGVLKGEETALAGFWPYVFGADGGDVDAKEAEIYSDLMAQSQGLVAEETLRTIRLDGIRHLLDVGGGTGAFLRAVSETYPDLEMTLFDLPSVVMSARGRLSTLVDRINFTAGSFRDDSLPNGADAVSLIRVLFDHQDDTVRTLLTRVYAVLPANGRLIISEPMSGGARPNRATDAYFSFYTMAMQTGKVRSQQEISELLKAAGFEDISMPTSSRPFVTSVVTARKLTA